MTIRLNWKEYKMIKEKVITHTNWLEGNAPIYYNGYDLDKFKSEEL